MKAHGRESLNQPAPIKSLPAQPADVGDLLKPVDYILLGKHLYILANKVRKAVPWENMFEDQLFGVQVPGTERVWFVNVTGARGQFPDLYFFDGYDGLDDYKQFRFEADRILKKGCNIDAFVRAVRMPRGMNCIHHILLTFTEREFLREEDMAAIEEAGLDFWESEGWPLFEETIPGYAPVYPGRERLVEIFLVLQQVLVVREKAKAQLRYMERDLDPYDTLLVRVPEGQGPGFRWTDQYLLDDPSWGAGRYLPRVSDEIMWAFTDLRQSSQVLLVDLLMSMDFLSEGEEETGPYPFFLLMVDKHSGHVYCQVMLKPEPDLGTMYESVPQRIIEELIKIGHRPSEIFVRSDLLHTLLAIALYNKDCRVEIEYEMPEMDRAVDLLFGSEEGGF